MSHLFIFNTLEKPLLTADADRGLAQKNPISPKLSPFLLKYEEKLLTVRVDKIILLDGFFES